MNYLKIIVILLLFSLHSFAQTDKPKFREIKIVKTLNNCNTDSTNCTFVKVDYLEMVSGKNKVKVNKLINNITTNFAAGYGDSSYNSIESAAESFVRDFAEFEYSDTSYKPLPWANEVAAIQEKSIYGIICISFSQFIFTGGAHPNFYFILYNIDYETGDTISLTDIFVKGFEKALDKKLDRKYRKENNISPDADLFNEGLFVSKIEHNNNFAILKEGVRFFYNQYEIAPYAAGTTEILLAYEELSGIIKPGGLLDQ